MSGQKRKRAVSDANTLLTNYYSSENSTVIAQDSFQGTYVKCFQYIQIRVSVSSDVNGVLSITSSFDGENDNETVTYAIVGGTTFSTALALIQPWIKVSFTADTPGTISSLTIYTLLARTPTSSITSGAGDVSLVSSSLGPDMRIKALCEGNNITLADDGECITINSNSAGTVTLSSFGTGVSLVEDGTGPDIVVNSLVNGSDISITDDPVNGVVIANTAPDQTVALNSADTSVTITGTYPTFDLQVTGGTATDVTWTSVGGGSSIVNQSLGPNLVAKSIIGGAGINVTDGGSDLTVVNTAPDQTVALNSADASVTITGTYPTFDLAVAGGGSNSILSYDTTISSGTMPQLLGDVVYFNVDSSRENNVVLYRPKNNGTITSMVMMPHDEAGYTSDPTRLDGGAFEIDVFSFPNNTATTTFGSITVLSGSPHFSFSGTSINTASTNYNHIYQTASISLTAGVLYGFRLTNNITNSASRPSFRAIRFYWTIE